MDKHHAGLAAQAEKDRLKQADLDGTSSSADGIGSQVDLGETSPLTRLVSFLLSGLEANMDSKISKLQIGVAFRDLPLEQLPLRGQVPQEERTDVLSNLDQAIWFKRWRGMTSWSIRR